MIVHRTKEKKLNKIRDLRKVLVLIMEYEHEDELKSLRNSNLPSRVLFNHAVQLPIE